MEKKVDDWLTDLRQVSIDAIHAYDQVIPKIEDHIMRDRLTVFRHSHARHAAELGQVLDDMKECGSSLSSSQDLKGYVLEGMAAIRSMGGTKNALKALLPVEELTNHRYGEAVSLSAPVPVRDLVRKHFSDVKIHLDYITSNLEAHP